METIIKYPIGQQNFKNIRTGDYLYVDKTSFVDRIITSGAQFLFLARPRRFGKSLFLSTLEYFFKGERDLFKGLFIDSSNWDWESYPVLRFDLNRERYAQPELFDSVINNIFDIWDEEYGIDTKGTDLSSRFGNIIRAIHLKTGRQVVILVDEYDKPLVGNLNKGDNFELFRDRLAAIYSNFKSNAEHIRLVFLTGVSRFSKLSIFSDLNNINDITFDAKFADICGITSDELLKYFQNGIHKFSILNNTSVEKTLDELKYNYDGYRFAERGSEIYNPWSLLNAMERSKIEFFWNDTGLPTIIAETLKNINANLEETFNTFCSQSQLKGLDLLNPDPIALLYQTGYLTIKDYDRESATYRLGIPNREVNEGLFRVLLPYYVKSTTISGNSLIDDIVGYFIFGNPEKALKAMQIYFAGVDYAMKFENENNFHNAFFILCDLIGLRTKTEVHTSSGRIDLEISTNRFIYIIELKYDHSAEDALRQINERNYTRKYQTDGRKLFKIGVAFSSKTRCIEEWVIE